MRDKRGHSFISHTPSTHAHTSLTGLSSLLSQASLVLSVSLKRKKTREREREHEMEEGCQGRGEKGAGKRGEKGKRRPSDSSFPVP